MLWVRHLFLEKVRRVAADKSRFGLRNAKVRQSHAVVCARLKNLLMASRRGQITLWFAQCEGKAVARGSLCKTKEFAYGESPRTNHALVCAMRKQGSRTR